jgi:hypothetical protein
LCYLVLILQDHLFTPL